jgi:hypothetical protein
MLLLGDAGALGEDSVRILSVDHGHMWHEHGELFLEHGPTNNVYQPLLNTPLCIQAPFLSVKAHRQRVMLTDIFPTLNQRISAFAPVDEACFNPYYAMPLDQRLESGEPLAFATEAGSCVVYLDEFKAVWNHRVGRPSLCHALVGDPNEERNLFARVDSGAIRRMRETIADYFARESGCLRAVLPLAGEQEFVGISEETKSALAALGYLE